MSYTACLFHIVFGTKKRAKSLSIYHRESLRRYFYGIANNMKCDILSINIMPEHVHIFINLNAEVSLAKFVGTIKQSSSIWLKDNINFAMFDGWAREYYGVSVSPSNKDNVKKYIENQEQHHGVMNFGEEIKWLVETIGMQFYKDSFV